uniref:DUF4283 domain-containing protein n=1 Tax=Nicotiana tabacum TaxID=4097 RepID=A0A1S4CXZ9_TOBAC|nr:PREDICTED: uncharacterized protein LOC107823827 [Nicotiana tabacum]
MGRGRPKRIVPTIAAMGRFSDEDSNSEDWYQVGGNGNEGEARKTTPLATDADDKGQKQWTNLFVGSTYATKGMDLSYIAPITKNGEVRVELCKEEIEVETQKWKLALILYVVGGSPTIGAMERYIASVWNFVSKPKVYFHNDGYFVVRFNSIKDRDEVLYSGPHMLNNKPIIVKVWSGDFDFNKEVLQTIAVWVKYPNLPLNYWGNRALSRISSGLGVPLYADTCTTQVDRVSYARVLVEMDVTKELPKSIKVTDPNGREFVQEVAYDLVSEFCIKCMQVGHQCRMVEQPKMRNKSTKQKQEWQPKVIPKAKEPVVMEQSQGRVISNEKNVSSNASISGIEEQKWQTVIGKSAARKSKMQIELPSQVGEGTSRQLGDAGQEGATQTLFIPV